MRIVELLEEFAAALAGNEVLRGWCVDRFGREPRICLGINGKAPPTGKDCPLVILSDGIASEGNDQDEIGAVVIEWSVSDDRISLRRGAEICEGFLAAQTLGDLIWAALPDVTRDYKVSGRVYELEGMEFFPQFPGRMEVSVRFY